MGSGRPSSSAGRWRPAPFPTTACLPVPSSPSSRPPGRLACAEARVGAGKARDPVTPQTNHAARTHLQTTSLSSAYGVS